MCNFMMHDWVIKHIIVTAANVVFWIHLPCVILEYLLWKWIATYA